MKEIRMKPDPEFLLKQIGITTPLIGFYDAPDPARFEPLVMPAPGKHACCFAFYNAWLQGKTLLMTGENAGCGGSEHHLFNITKQSREDFIKFLVDGEGLKDNGELMNRWVDKQKPYQPEHPNIFIGPLKPGQEMFLKTITFYVNPDQLSSLMLGAQYFMGPDDPTPVMAPFGSGCMQMMPLFDDLSVPGAIIGATDIAMRQYLPPDILAFTVTQAMFELLCRLDNRSFLNKPFLKNLQKSRGQA